MDRVGCSGLNKTQFKADMKLSETPADRGQAAPGVRWALHYEALDMPIETIRTINVS